MLALNTPNCVTSLLSRRLKGKGIGGAQKAQKAQEGGGGAPYSSLSNACHTGHTGGGSLLFPFERLPHSLPGKTDLLTRDRLLGIFRTKSVRASLLFKSGSSKCTRKPNHLSKFVCITLNFECHVHTSVVDSMKSFLKIDGGDFSKEVEDEPEIIENNFLARGKFYCVASSVI